MYFKIIKTLFQKYQVLKENTSSFRQSSYIFSLFIATAPAFPYLPPPPPPPIEDIPGRTPVQRQRSLGHVSNRGTYSDAETCVCQRHYGDSYSAHYHRGHYSDMDTSSRLRHCPYSEGESDFEPHYLEQTASGNVYIPGKILETRNTCTTILKCPKTLFTPKIKKKIESEHFRLVYVQ